MQIFKKDTKGKIRVLDVHALNGTVVQISGLLKGKRVTHTKTCKPKNTGKKNATTAQEQALKETQSILTKKLREGYFKSEREAVASNVILPMLAKSLKDHESKVTYPCFVQPKFDGIRCLAFMKNNTITLMSRKNVEITTMDHLKDDLMERYEEGMILDGELYAHGLSFQENMKLIKKYREGTTERVNYYIYDKVSKAPFTDRTMELAELRLSTSAYLQPVLTMVLNNRKDLKLFHDEFLKQGFEGTMIRWGDASYKIGGRSANLLKHKDFEDVALPIIDIVESDRVPGQGIVVIEYNGHRSKTGSKLSHEDRADLLTNKSKYIGKIGEFRYFELTDKGGLRFPIYMGLRLDK